MIGDLCDEEVSRRGIAEPCELPAVALRRDPESRAPYPVCTYHARSVELMIPLRQIVGLLDQGPA